MEAILKQTISGIVQYLHPSGLSTLILFIPRSIKIIPMPNYGIMNLFLGPGISFDHKTIKIYILIVKLVWSPSLPRRKPVPNSNSRNQLHCCQVSSWFLGQIQKTILPNPEKIKNNLFVPFMWDVGQHNFVTEGCFLQPLMRYFAEIFGYLATVNSRSSHWRLNIDCLTKKDTNKKALHDLGSFEMYNILKAFYYLIFTVPLHYYPIFAVL